LLHANDSVDDTFCYKTGVHSGGFCPTPVGLCP